MHVFPSAHPRHPQLPWAGVGQPGGTVLTAIYPGKGLFSVAENNKLKDAGAGGEGEWLLVLANHCSSSAKAQAPQCRWAMSGGKGALAHP